VIEVLAGGRDRIPTLDGWRAISAFMVIASHLLFGIIDGVGELGVEIFFGISGYVICRSFILEVERHGYVCLKGFYLRRAFRIIPPLLLYVTLILLLVWAGYIPEWARPVVRALTFTCNFPDANCGGWFGAHTWSLSVEEQFYIVIPIMFAGIGMQRRWIMTFGILCFPFFVLFLYLAHCTASASFLSRFVTIGFGVFCAINESTVQKLVSRSPIYVFTLVIGAMAFIALYSGSRTATILHVLVLPPLIMFSLIQPIVTPSMFSRLLNSRPLQWVGAISYSLYLWQQLATWPHRGTAFNAIGVVGCVFFAYVSFQFFEKPLIRAGRVLSNSIHAQEGS
jgi:peptidoglycan/LPS O-acetylase OafA/YrhL